MLDKDAIHLRYATKHLCDFTRAIPLLAKDKSVRSV